MEPSHLPWRAQHLLKASCEGWCLLALTLHPSLGCIWTASPYKFHSRRIRTNIGYLRDAVFRSLVIKVYCTLGFVSFFSHSKKFKATKLASKKFAKALSEAMIKYNYIFKPDAKWRTILYGRLGGWKEECGLGGVSPTWESNVPSSHAQVLPGSLSGRRGQEISR